MPVGLVKKRKKIRVCWFIGGFMFQIDRSSDKFDAHFIVRSIFALCVYHLFVIYSYVCVCVCVCVFGISNQFATQNTHQWSLLRVFGSIHIFRKILQQSMDMGDSNIGIHVYCYRCWNYWYTTFVAFAFAFAAFNSNRKEKTTTTLKLSFVVASAHPTKNRHTFLSNFVHFISI